MTDSRPRNDAAMADILSSIRRIVAEDERRPPLVGVGAEDILELTVDMRAPDDAPPATAAPEPFPLSADEARMAVIVRTALRDELDGAFGHELQRRLRDIVRDEVSRALAESRGARD